MPNEQAQRWQRRFDEAFPDGLIITVPDPAKHAYPVARPEVVTMRGLNPVVNFELHGFGGRNLVFEIVSWDEEQASPCRLVRCTVNAADHPDEVILLSGNVSSAHADVMRESRRESLQLSEDGGVYQQHRWGREEP